MQVGNKMKILGSIIILITMNHALANSKDCPPVSQIKEAAFNKAHRYGNAWNLFSNTFVYDGMEWNVVFSTNLPDTQDPVTALKLGQNSFMHSPLLAEGKYRIFNKTITCIYNPNTGYDVYAQTPPANYL